MFGGSNTYSPGIRMSRATKPCGTTLPPGQQNLTVWRPRLKLQQKKSQRRIVSVSRFFQALTGVPMEVSN